MIDLLKNQYINYLIIRKQTLVPFNVDSLNIKSEITSDEYFDIKDEEITILQNIGYGSATYHNPELKKITIIDFEDFIEQLPDTFQKDLKRCDFIVYDTEGKAFFILNELSQSLTVENKRRKALQQLNQTALYFSQTCDINEFINSFEIKKCIFSNKDKLISDTPNNNADAFSLIQDYLPDPLPLNFQPITKLGYELFETAIVEV